jgi:cytochrome-b5 reductase
MPASAATFGDGDQVTLSPTKLEARDVQGVTVYHVMVKSPDLMIERPYTPVNDVRTDGEVRLVVKRVRGGEVGR